MSFTHANRPLKLTTSLGEDVLLLTGFHGQESISAPYHFGLEVVSSDPHVTPGDVLRKPATVSLELSDGSTRYFHGLIRRFVRAGRDKSGMVMYRAEIVPWLWFLELSTDCRIFQNMSVQQIVTAIFEDNGYHDYEFRDLTAGQAPRVYCVQYRESAFNFVSRLLEEEGIFYFFEHEAGRHLLVLGDTALQHPPCPGPLLVSVSGMEHGVLEDDTILELSICDEVQSGKIGLTDFNFEMPGSSLLVEVGERDEVYDYPGLYDNRSQGSSLSSVRLEEHLVAIQRLQGSSGCRAFTTGHYFKVKDFHRTDAKVKQVLHTISHQARQPMNLSTDDADGVFRYQNTFSSFPYATPFRPPRSARRPVVTGTQTAIVVGKAGEEIWCDSYGRVKVQFHWDRRGKRDEESSCWVRVSHGWAGSSWGSIYIPRMGQEVIVDFLEGDPDRPIITGRVYNAEQMPPYTLPAEQTKSTIKSNSSKGGEGFNELRFEDKKGSEEVFLHAQKDWNTKVLHDRSTTVGRNQSTHVGHEDSECSEACDFCGGCGDQSLTVGMNRSVTIGKDENITIHANQTQTIDKNQTLTVTQNRTRTVTGHEAVTIDSGQEIKIKKKREIDIKGGETYTVTDGRELTITGDEKRTVNGATTLTLNGTMTLNLSDARTSTLKMNDTLTIEGTLTIVANKGIEISSPKLLKISSSDQVVIGAGNAVITLDSKQGSVGISGTKITSAAVGTHEISGALIKIN